MFLSWIAESSRRYRNNYGFNKRKKNILSATEYHDLTRNQSHANIKSRCAVTLFGIVPIALFLQKKDRLICRQSEVSIFASDLGNFLSRTYLGSVFLFRRGKSFCVNSEAGSYLKEARDLSRSGRVVSAALFLDTVPFLLLPCERPVYRSRYLSLEQKLSPHRVRRFLFF